MSVHVLFAASEAAPLSKTGGLADVAQSLPKALQDLGHDLRVVTPAYRGALERLVRPRRLGSAEVRGHRFTVWEGGTETGGATQWLVDCPGLYVRDGSPYLDPEGREFEDNARRFGLFSEFVARLALGQAGLAWRPDVVHLNDWHTGIAAAWLSQARIRPPCVFTIHNLAYQGNYPVQEAATLGLPPGLVHPGGAEFHGLLSFLKAGLVFADVLTTVSPTYAKEIQTPEYGERMDGVLRARAKVLTGIVNGIDQESWNPATDPGIARRYDFRKMVSGKRANRRALQERLGLERGDGRLLVAFIGRLAYQKGADLLLKSTALLDEIGLQFALLGTGDPVLELAFMDFAKLRPGRIAVTIGYDEALAHQIEAGADMLIMPSRYEPCGLNQMYSQRYGTVPVVRRTGGLVDTVTDATPATLKDGTATGVLFDHADAGGIAFGLRRAVELWWQPEAWRSLQRNGMQRDFSWTGAARQYVELYESVMAARGPAADAVG